jgi:FMN reductase
MAWSEGRISVVGIGGTLRPASTSRMALEHALHAAEDAGAATELVSLNDWRLPMFEPGKPLEDYEPIVARFIDIAQHADAMIWSTAGYHGTIAGVTKNALDFLEFLSGSEPPYLHQRVVGLIATGAGELAAVNAINAMVHVVHALRGTVAPLFVPVPRASQSVDTTGHIVDQKIAGRLDMLGKLVVETTKMMQTIKV